MVAMNSSRGASPGDERALDTLIKLNDPRNILTQSALSSREIPPTPQLLRDIKERFVTTHAHAAEEDMDEDDIRTRRYWRRWGNRAAKELVKVIEREKIQKMVKRRELVYSARLREPVFRRDSDDSDHDSDTAISLLTTSSVAAREAVTFAPHPKRKKSASKDTQPKVNWEKFARQRQGIIDRMMRTDASALGSMVRGGVASMEVTARETALDIMSEAERNLVLRSAYTKGLYGAGNKSQSTENVVSIPPKRLASANRRSPMAFSRLTAVSTPVKSDHLPSRGTTPTPSQITESLSKSKRSESMLITNGSPTGSRVNSGHSRTQQRHTSIVSNSVPKSVSTYMKGVQGLPDFEGKFSKRVRSRIRRTISALGRIVGEGDELDVIAEIPGEKGRYTQDDYARVPKYPQRVLITPQLAQVIKHDIRDRMGRPRCHQILKYDIDYFDKQNPPIDRSHRNLLIFNWLISISEDEFEVTEAPEIVDLEGKLAEYRNVLKHDDVMSREPTTLSHISGGMSDGASEFTMSAYSAGEDEEDDHVSLTPSDEYTEGTRMSPGMSYLSSSRPDTNRT